MVVFLLVLAIGKMDAKPMDDWYEQWYEPTWSGVVCTSKENGFLCGQFQGLILYRIVLFY